MDVKVIDTLKEYDKSYYNKESEVSDEYYDRLKDRARSLFPDHPYFSTVGADVKSDKVHLGVILGSLNKVNPENVDEWMREHPGPWCIQKSLMVFAVIGTVLT